MSDLIDRDKAIAVIDRCKHRLQGQGSTYEIMLDMIKTIPSAEPTWTSVLAELHEQLSALEKEIRKASAELSAVIREYVDRPKGDQIAIGAVCEVICKHCIKANGHCQHHWKCPLLTEIAELMEPKDEPQTEREGE